MKLFISGIYVIIFFAVNVSAQNVTVGAGSYGTTPNIWDNQSGVIGMTIEGRHYGIFAPDSSSWTGTTILQSSLNGKDYFSVALLPDNNLSTLETYRKHAYAFVTDSKVEWKYNEVTAQLTSTFSYTTELKELKNGNLNQTLTALYRHQWLNTSMPITSFEYISVAGKMNYFAASGRIRILSFSVQQPAPFPKGWICKSGGFLSIMRRSFFLLTVFFYFWVTLLFNAIAGCRLNNEDIRLHKSPKLQYCPQKTFPAGSGSVFLFSRKYKTTCFSKN